MATSAILPPYQRHAKAVLNCKCLKPQLALAFGQLETLTFPFHPSGNSTSALMAAFHQPMRSSAQARIIPLDFYRFTRPSHFTITGNTLTHDDALARPRPTPLRTVTSGYTSSSPISRESPFAGPARAWLDSRFITACSVHAPCGGWPSLGLESPIANTSPPVEAQCLKRDCRPKPVSSPALQGAILLTPSSAIFALYSSPSAIANRSRHNSRNSKIRVMPSNGEACLVTTAKA